MENLEKIAKEENPLESIKASYLEYAFNENQPFLKEIFQLVKSNPNDGLLGTKVRKIIGVFEKYSREKSRVKAEHSLKSLLQETENKSKF